MAANKNLKNLPMTVVDGNIVIHLGEIEIWDGADLALLREAMAFLFNQKQSRSFGVDMTHVKYIPSGFFGMLFDWHERGVCVRLYDPQPHVQRMLWFTQFFRDLGEARHELSPSQHSMIVADFPEENEVVLK